MATVVSPDGAVRHSIRDRALLDSAALLVGDDAALGPERRWVRAEIADLQSRMMASPERVHIEPTHIFAQGLYVREVALPAGTIAVGHIHAQEHVCIVSKGRVSVVTEAGAREVVAPATFVVPRGTKNVVRVEEDAVWTTIHATEERDVATLEATLLLPAHDDLRIAA